MKSFLILLFFVSTTYSQICTDYGEEPTVTQAQLILESNCTIISGDLYAFELPNFTFFENIEEIRGGLYIGADFSFYYDLPFDPSKLKRWFGTYGLPSPQNLDGLQNLKKIGKELAIILTGELTDVTLESLIDVSDIIIAENSNLEKINIPNVKSVDLFDISSNPILSYMNFENLLLVESDCYIGGPDLIQNFSGFSNLESVGQGFAVYDHDLVVSLGGFFNLKSVDLFAVDNLRNLTNIDEFENLKIVTDDLYLYNLSKLENIYGLRNLEELHNSLEVLNFSNSGYIEFCYSLESIEDFSGTNFMSIHDLNIIGNTKLKNLNGLEGIVGIEDDFRITDNDALEDINALSNIKSIGDEFFIIQNPTLKNLDGLYNLTETLENVIIQENGIENLYGLKNAKMTFGFSFTLINNPNLICDICTVQIIETFTEKSVILENQCNSTSNETVTQNCTMYESLCLKCINQEVVQSQPFCGDNVVDSMYEECDNQDTENCLNCKNVTKSSTKTQLTQTEETTKSTSKTSSEITTGIETTSDLTSSSSQQDKTSAQTVAIKTVFNVANSNSLKVSCFFLLFTLFVFSLQ